MKNWMKRALRTAFQTIIGYIAVAMPSIDWGADRSVLKPVLIGIGVSAVSAGLAAAMNLDEED